MAQTEQDKQRVADLALDIVYCIHLERCEYIQGDSIGGSIATL
jgi:hypothetical protein